MVFITCNSTCRCVIVSDNEENEVTILKQSTLTSAVIKIRNDLQPKFTDNTDMLIYDYDFFTQLESFAKKEREKSKQKALDASPHADKTDGTILRTVKQELVVKSSKASDVFDLATFIDNVADKLGVDKFKLKELATVSVKPGTPRKTYSVEQIDE